MKHKIQLNDIQHKYIITARYEGYENETLISGYDRELKPEEVLKMVREIYDGGLEEIEVTDVTVYVISVVHVWTSTSGQLFANNLSEFPTQFEANAEG